jgi:hypothetical protein
MSFHAAGMLGMYPRIYFLFFLASMLGACAHAQMSSKPNRVEDATSMSMPTTSDMDDQNAIPLQPKLTPEQGLTRLLGLIRTSRVLSDFTPERVGQAMGLEMELSSSGPEEYGFFEPVTPEWSQGLDFSKKHQRLRFGFDPRKPGASPDLTDVCQVDFDKFSTELEAMGFVKSPSYGEHGRLMHFTFERVKDGALEMRLDITPEGEHAWNEQTGSGRVCIRNIYIY